MPVSPEPEQPPPMFDADGAISREYLLYRGYCCRNGCRNCPYGFPPRRPSSREAAQLEDPAPDDD